MTDVFSTCAPGVRRELSTEKEWNAAKTQEWYHLSDVTIENFD